MKKLLIGLAAVVAGLVLFYFSYWVGKNVSYWFFYEDLVKETINEIVKQSALK